MENKVYNLLTVNDFDKIKLSNIKLSQRKFVAIEESLSWNTLNIKDKDDWEKQENSLAITKIYDEVKFKNKKFQMVVLKPGEKDFNDPRRFDDIRPVFDSKNEWVTTFEECWSGLESVSKSNLLILNWLVFRMAYMYDHEIKNGKCRLKYHNKVQKYLESLEIKIKKKEYFCENCSVVWDGGRSCSECKSCIKQMKVEVKEIPAIVYLQMVDLIGLSEDLFAFRRTDKYKHESNKGNVTESPYGEENYPWYKGWPYGKVNTLSTFCNFAASLSGEVSWSKFAGSFARPPRGISPITRIDAKMIFNKFIS